ncbi:MAG: thiaminase II [Deltaproteobacteria bacterium]|jgi:thiaminase/transcriptional activator TenA|nr:thiaminase II [Deltaproteobacteria bacterium]
MPPRITPKPLSEIDPTSWPLAMESPGAWSQKAWKIIEPILDDILSHPFITKLVKGTLPKEIFLFYIEQDALYLDDFGKIVAASAVKISNRELAQNLFESALDSIKVEGSLHSLYLGEMERTLKQSPTNLMYTSFLYRHLACSNKGTLIASLLPCFWIYMVVGHHILSLATSPGNPYQEWINTYGGEEYSRAVEKIIKATDYLAENSSASERLSMLEAFVMSSKMEWLFWDSAWRKEKWPI